MMALVRECPVESVPSQTARLVLAREILGCPSGQLDQARLENRGFQQVQDFQEGLMDRLGLEDLLAPGNRAFRAFLVDLQDLADRQDQWALERQVAPDFRVCLAVRSGHRRQDALAVLDDRGFRLCPVCPGCLEDRGNQEDQAIHLCQEIQAALEDRLCQVPR